MPLVGVGKFYPIDSLLLPWDAPRVPSCRRYALLQAGSDLWNGRCTALPGGEAEMVGWGRWFPSWGLVLWFACTPSYFEPDEIRQSISIDWGPQRERDSFDFVVERCETGLGMKFAHGAWVKFIHDPTTDCRTGHEKVAGCWIHDFDLVLLAPAERLVDTALCHELLHRQLFLDVGDPDPGHRRQEWSDLGSILSGIRQEEALTR